MRINGGKGKREEVKKIRRLYTFCILNSHKQAVSAGKMNCLIMV
jgi:hypothetical protein